MGHNMSFIVLLQEIMLRKLIIRNWIMIALFNKYSRFEGICERYDGNNYSFNVCDLR